MTLSTGLTTLHEDDIARHQSVAQGLVTKLIILGRTRARPAPRLQVPVADSCPRFRPAASAARARWN